MSEGTGERLLDSREVGELLNVSARKVQSLATADDIPAVRVGHQWRFRRESVERWIYEQEQRAIKKADAAAAQEKEVREWVKAGLGRKW